MQTTSESSTSLRPRWYVIVTTILQHLAIIPAFFPVFFNWSAVGVALLLHFITMGLGISLGFHRLATHRSFKAPKWLEYFFVLCGTLAAQGSVMGWVGYHRMHHLHSDQPEDPHDSSKGFWWSHMGWLMYDIPNEPERYRLTRDIADDPFYVFCHNYHTQLQIALGFLLYGIGGWPFVVWGIFVRLFVGHHATFFVNSACHILGYRSHDSKDTSTNCWWVALLTFGEGWHNNHHAYQSSARFGLDWWELDMVWWVIWGLEKLGLVSNVKTATIKKLT
jgi:sn-1 stearoyl-lipid 9-desaturase